MNTEPEVEDGTVPNMAPWASAVATVLDAMPPPGSDGRSNEHERRPVTDPPDILDVLRTLAASGDCVADAGGCVENNDMLFARDVSEGGRKGALSAVDLAGETLQFAVGGVTLAITNPWLKFIRHSEGLGHSIFLLTGTPANSEAVAWQSASMLLQPPQLLLVISRTDSLGATAAHPSLTIRPSPMIALHLTIKLGKGDPAADTSTQERRKLELQAREVLAKAFQHRHPERMPLTQEDVNEIGWHALTLGVQPTVELIREVAGGGSPNTIHPLLKNFYATLLDKHFEPQVPPDIPESAVRMWHQVLELARREADERMTADRAELQRERQRHAESIAAFGREAATREEATAARERELAAAEQALQTTIEDLRERLSSKEAQAQQLGTELSATKDRLSSVNAERDKLKEALSAERSARSEEAALLRSKIAAQQEQIDNLSAELERTRNESGEQLSALREALLESQRDAEAARRQAEAADERAAASESARAATATNYEHARAELTSATSDIERLRAELSAVTRERDRGQVRLDALIHQLGADAAANQKAINSAGESTR